MRIISEQFEGGVLEFPTPFGATMERIEHPRPVDLSSACSGHYVLPRNEPLYTITYKTGVAWQSWRFIELRGSFTLEAE